MKVLFVTILAGILFLFSNALKAQELRAKHNAISLSPLSLAAGNYNSARIRLQHSLKFRFAFGADVKYYFPNQYPGYQVSPFVKMFTAKENSEGVYIYATAVYGKNKGLPDDKTIYYECYGIGGGAGYQAVFGKTKCWLFDMALGFKSVTTHSDLSPHDIPEEYLVYYIVGPAAILDGNLSIGFRF